VNLNRTRKEVVMAKARAETETKSWFKIIDDPTVEGELKEYFSGKRGKEFCFSTGTIEMQLYGKHVKQFETNPAKFIRKLLVEDGRTVNGIKVILPVERRRTLSKSRMAGGIYCKCEWVHIDEPEEHESTWICIKLPGREIFRSIGW
jgi:hypothetical protein